ncbi:rhodanese-like domain-containing protein [Streptomyces sp. NPDC056503]|uniref:rhodanese-like domain-containing protein n=1 Tax=Streptomyces sp. NPDC056503 TaxID=3345842 RepID=UPI003677EF55
MNDLEKLKDELNDEERKVLGVPAAEPAEAVEYFYRTKLRCETDPYDVNHDLVAGIGGFVVLDVRRPASYRDEHVAGARNLSHHDMTPEVIAALDPEQVYVTYGWGPGCNGGTRGAAKLAAHGLRVKEMLGGLEYWKRQGFPVESGS